jgi:hypothetical protein
LKVHLHDYFNMKSQKEVTKKVEIKVFLLFLLIGERILIQAQKYTDPTYPDPASDPDMDPEKLYNTDMPQKRIVNG